MSKQTEDIYLHKPNLKGIINILSKVTKAGKRYRIKITEWLMDKWKLERLKANKPH